MVSLRLMAPNGFLFLFFLIRSSLQASFKGKLSSVGLEIVRFVHSEAAAQL